ncbi:MAG: hypothetical protein ABJE47_17390 [bacterium]
MADDKHPETPITMPPFTILVRDEPNPFEARSRRRHMRFFFAVLSLTVALAIIAGVAVYTSRGGGSVGQEETEY